MSADNFQRDFIGGRADAFSSPRGVVSIVKGFGLRLLLTRQAARVHHHVWWARAVTLGVRVIVLDGDSVFLVRHTYVPGWYLPGGAVDRRESAEAAALRELREEGGIRCLGRPALHVFYRNGHRDHVACYIVRSFERERLSSSAGWEIAQSGFFPIAALPEGTTKATRARLEEVLNGECPSESL